MSHNSVDCRRSHAAKRASGCRTDARWRALRRGDDLPCGWGGTLAFDCVSFASHFHEYSGLRLRDGDLGLAGLDLGPETAAGGSAPAREPFLVPSECSLP